LLGQAGIPIQAFGTTARCSSSELASVSGPLGDTGGAGTTGDAIGITTTRRTTTSAITRKAGRFITATDSIEATAPAVITTVPKERHSLRAGKVRARAGLTTVPERRRSLSVATTGLLAATPSLAARVVFAPAPSAVLRPAERNGIFRRAGAPASAAEAVFAADATERIQFISHIQNGRTTRCDKRA